jgi:hypothetical protein
MSIHAAGFAGAGLLTALAIKNSLSRSFIAGTILSCAMTAIPYGFITWVDAQLAGPIEIVALVSADVAPNEVPVRRAGAEVAKLSDEEVSRLKEKWLVTKGQNEFEVIDEQGRRYWPLWRKTFVYPGNPSKEIRRVFVLIPPDLSEAGTWNLPLSSDSHGVSVVQLDSQSRLSAICPSPTNSIKCEFVINDSNKTLTTVTVKIKRISPVGNFYSPDPVKSGLALQFPPLRDQDEHKPDTNLKTKKRPNFDNKEGQ